MTGFNLGCVDEIDTFNFESVHVNDGKNHPLDKNKYDTPKSPLPKLKTILNF